MIVGGQVRVENGRAVLSGKYSYDAIQLIKAIPGKWTWREREVLFDPSPGNVEYLRKVFRGSITWAPELTERVEQFRSAEAEAAAIKAGATVYVGDYPFPRQPMEHQLRGYVLALARAYFGLLPQDMGTGKTKVALDVIGTRATRGRLRLAIILAPNGVHRKWLEREAPIDLPGKPGRDWDGFLWQGRPGQERQLEGLSLTAQDRLVLVAVNIEALSGGLEARPAKQLRALIRAVMAAGWETMIVVDESSRIKTPGATRTRVAGILGKEVTYRMILSGTPMTKGAEDLYAQLQFLSPDILDVRTYAAYKARYCKFGGFEGRKIIGYQNLEELRRRMDPWTFGVTKEECLDLPPKVYVEVPVELTAEQRRAYDAIRDEAIFALDNDSVITSTNALATLTKLQQILCGYLPYSQDDARAGQVHPIPSNRGRIAGDLVEAAPRQSIVWGRFRFDINVILEDLKGRGIKAVRYDGQTSERERSANLANFKAGLADVFVGTPAAGGIGLDLYEADNMVYYANSFDAEHRWQSEDRAHRLGQTRSLTISDLVAPGTVDRKFIQSLRDKKSLSTELFANGPSALRDFLEAA